MNTLRQEQRYAIKFCFRMRLSADQTYKLLKEAYKESVLNRKSIIGLYREFANGRVSCEALSRSGAPTTASSEEIVNSAASFVNEDPRLAVKDLSVMLDVARTSTHRILKEFLNLSHVCSRWVPSALSVLQKSARVEACNLWKKNWDDSGDEWLQDLITVDESWIYCWMDHSPSDNNGIKFEKHGKVKTRRVRVFRSVAKIMIVSFFDCRGPLYVHCVPVNSVVTGTDYRDMLTELINEHIPKKRPELNGRWKLHYDNSRPHVAVSVNDFLDQKGISYVAHPANSPDLAPSDFFLYPILRKRLMGARFDNESEAVKALETALEGIRKAEYQFAIMDEWRKRWDRCIAAEGEYLESERGKT